MNRFNIFNMLLQSVRELLVPDETAPGDQAVNRGLNLVFSISPRKSQMGVKKNKLHCDPVLQGELCLPEDVFCTV